MVGLRGKRRLVGEGKNAEYSEKHVLLRNCLSFKVKY